jgi:signal transduction histidine kinase
MHLSNRILQGPPGPKSDSLLVRYSRAAILVVFAYSSLFHAFSGAQVKETRRVLILNDLGITASPGFAEIEQALWAGLKKSPYHIELYQESLELTLFPDEVHQRRFREEFIRKYSERQPDVIIAAGPDSLNFIAESNQDFLRHSQIIFCAILGQIPDRLRPDMHFTGVLARLQPEETLRVALRLLPSTKHVVVTGGVGKFDYRWEAIAKQSFHEYESKLDFMYLTDLSMPTMLEQLRKLPQNTIVYHTAMTQDAAGERFIDSADAVPLVASAANAPVFVMDDVDLNGGTVGGDLVNWADDARVAAGMAVRVLNGERPQDIPVVTSKNTYMFDWRALKRWGLKEKNLPPGSVLLHRQPTAWELFKWYIMIGVSLILIETWLILGLLWQRARRRKAEKAVAAMGRRLMAAHEEERAWIARELHDDINQQIALTTVKLDELKENVPEEAAASHDDIRQRLSNLGSAVRALSHRLHSSKLEYLGIVEAASSYCRELSEHLKVEIDFSHSEIPDDVPNEISLCIFRVLQEALQNAVKHSGVRHFKVELQGTSREIQLRVRDLGCGFDFNDRISGQGMGLISMRERLQFFNGVLSITSKPNVGTTIYAQVPIPTQVNGVSLAG